MHYRKGDYCIVPNKEFLRGKPASYKAVWLSLCDYADQDGQCFPSRSTIAKDSAISQHTVDRVLKQMVADGVLVKVARKNGNEPASNLYQLLIKGVASPQGGVASPETLPTLTRDTLTISTELYNPPTPLSKGEAATSAADEVLDTGNGEETTMSFYGFPLPPGWSEENLGLVEGSERPRVIVYNEFGRPVKQSELDRRRREHAKAVSPVKEPDATWQSVVKLLDSISGSLTRQYGSAPVVGQRERTAVYRLVKKMSPQFCFRYGRWFFENPAIPKKTKFQLLSFTATKFVNEFIADTTQ